jgi:hypothetical protein
MHSRHDDVPGVALNEAAVGDKRAGEEVVPEKGACVQPPAGCEHCEPCLFFSFHHLFRILRRKIWSALIYERLQSRLPIFMLIAWFKKIHCPT